MHSATTFALIALSAATGAVAKPHNWGGWHGKWHGKGHGHHRPTGGLDGDSNSTSTTTILSTSTIFSTVTVQPSTDGGSFNNVADATASASECSGTTTLTATSTQYITVTAGAASASNGTQENIPEQTPASTLVPDVSAGGFYGESTTQTDAASPTTSSSGSDSYSPASGSGGSKKGICFNQASNVGAFNGAVSWAYNWASTESGDLGSVEYVPMMWGRNNVADFASKVGNAKSVLSFNEPDLGAQANIDPQTAAKLHRQGVESLVGKVRIGSPAVTNANTTSPLMGQQWLEQFFQACGSGCPVDFIAFHWYATADSISYFKEYVNNMAAYAQSKGINNIWLTEFQPEGSSDAQASFMKEAVSFLESHPNVERYAGFMASEGQMMSGGSLNGLGQAYAG